MEVCDGNIAAAALTTTSAAASLFRCTLSKSAERDV